MNQPSPNLSMQPLPMDNQFRYTDEELIARFQEGDEQAYVELVNRYRDRLMTFVFRFVNDMEQAEDIVQDALLKLYTHKHYYKNIAKFSTWMYTIAGNLAKTELRKKKSHKTTNLSQMGPEDRDYELPAVEPHTDRKSTRSELQSHSDLVCRLLLEKKKKQRTKRTPSQHDDQ